MVSIKPYVIAGSIALVVIVCIAAGRILNERGTEQERIRRAGCRFNLEQIHSALQGYRDDHAGQYPITLNELFPNYLARREHLICNSDRTTTPADAEYLSYLYTPPVLITSADFVVVQDKHGNHTLRGVLLGGRNALYASGWIAWIDESAPQ